ncbi:hypothetical protein [Nonomuraea cavernae]|uniref:MFS transporter n=1 Tax=Nonomuraea cavernae TaxID=2045107 RepID=A0A917Z0V9_9ACTN|nr:hypothetical protein [Nonomuraea cavernae]MCA2187749.1 hypothetical protein [Nonomuraea cavernae]GGO71735.1 hypothetical protein GCM10012289_38110 [Nonomuraea cavernae]
MTTKASTALLTAVWGMLGGLLGPRTAIGLAGVLLLATPLLLIPIAPDRQSTRSRSAAAA